MANIFKQLKEKVENTKEQNKLNKEQNKINIEHKENYDKIAKLLHVYDGLYGEKDQQQVVDAILNEIDKDPMVLRVQSKNEKNITLGMAFAQRKIKDLFMRVMEDEVACCMTDIDGQHMGHYIAQCCNKDYHESPNRKDLLTMQFAALDNHKMATAQDNDGKNMGMLLARSCREGYTNEAIIKALGNKEAALQQDNDGKNMGMHTLEQIIGYDVFKIAMKNKEARKQEDKSGTTMDDLFVRRTLSDSDDKEILELREGVIQNRINNITGNTRVETIDVQDFGNDVDSDDYTIC